MLPQRYLLEELHFIAFTDLQQFLSHDALLRKSEVIVILDGLRALHVHAEAVKQLSCGIVAHLLLTVVHSCRKLGEHGLALLEPGQGILTHCNAGRLATVRYGTATAPIYLGHEKGYGFKVYADETRPLLQGARLTAFELRQAGIDVTLICDNMAATVMKQGRIQAVITGCDRLAANGDAANKIGTLGVAILAHHYGIPFYVAVPTSSIDFSIPDGRAIRIEERPGGEIREMWYSEPMAPEGVRTYNPAFDVTDAGLVSGIITEYGVLRPPYGPALEGLRATLRARAEAVEGGRHV